MRKKANCESATCNGVQLQDRLAGYSLLGDDISLRIGLVVSILCILIRPSMLYEAENMEKDLGGPRIFLKREDLNHTGAHKINIYPKRQERI